MLISEIFYSLQGEGMLTGLPSLFIRTSGCNLRCNWCDTDYASWEPTGEDMTIDEIVSHVDSKKCKHVVVTGGEPMIAKEIQQLCMSLKDKDCHITIETAGTISPENIDCDLASISPKMSNSTPDKRASESWLKRHERDRINLLIIQEWIDNYDYQLKFVIDSQNDVNEVLELLAQLKRDIAPYKVLLMPQGITKEEIDTKKLLVAEMCKEYGFRYCDRLHIELFGNKKGT